VSTKGVDALPDGVAGGGSGACALGACYCKTQSVPAPKPSKAQRERETDETLPGDRRVCLFSRNGLAAMLPSSLSHTLARHSWYTALGRSPAVTLVPAFNHMHLPGCQIVSFPPLLHFKLKKRSSIFMRQVTASACPVSYKSGAEERSNPSRSVPYAGGINPLRPVCFFTTNIYFVGLISVQ
jgi:hypothetical protein